MGTARVRGQRQKSDGQKAIDWIEEFCCIPEGKLELIGKRVQLQPWQKKIIKEIYDKPTRRAIITFGRKNGKTTLSAFLLLLHLCGPKARRNSQLYSAAQSRDQAALLFSLAAKMVRMHPDLAASIIVRDTPKELVCRELGTVYRALSAEATTAFGISPIFLVHDELGQVKGPRSPLYEALETATGAQDNPLSIVISTQAPTDGDLLSILVDDAQKEGDPKTRLFMYTADTEIDPFSVDAIKQANPAFGKFQNPVEVLAMAEDARRMPSREAEYRQLVLNQRVETSNPFISPSVWKECGGEVIESFEGKPVYAGLDLSETSDLTALVLIAPHDGKWHVRPVFWLPSDGLAERARRDRVEYDLWAAKCGQCVRDKVPICLHAEKALSTTPGRSVEYEWVATYLRGLFDRLDVRQLGFDRWGMRHLRPWLEKAGLVEAELDRFVEIGQGYQSMSPALRDLESDLLSGKIVHGNHPVLTMCAANAVISSDPAGNRKLDKKRARGRIDGLVALTMARAVAATEDLQPVPEYEVLVLGTGA